MNDNCAIGSLGYRRIGTRVRLFSSKRQGSLKPGIAKACGRVHDQSEPSEARLAFDARDDVIRDLNPLERTPETELARMDDKRVAVGNDDFLRQVRRRVTQIDRRRPVVVEDPERISQPQIDAGGLYHLRIPRIDLDPSLLHVLQDRPIGKHRSWRVAHRRRSLSADGRSRLRDRLRNYGTIRKRVVSEPLKTVARRRSWPERRHPGVVKASRVSRARARSAGHTAAR